MATNYCLNEVRDRRRRPQPAETLPETAARGLPVDQALAKGAPPGGGADGLDDLAPEARAEYDEKFLEIGDGLGIIGARGSVRTRVVYDAFQGEYRKRLEEPEFFRTVGRRDLADSYESRRATAYVLYGAAAVVIVGAFTWALWPGQSCPDDPADPGFGDCVRSKVNDFTPVWVAAGGAVIGSALGIAAWSVKIHPVEADEMRPLADQHNQALHRRLAGPREPAAPTTPRASLARSLGLAPFADGHGGGIGLTARF